MLRPLDALRDTRREWMINRSRLIAALVGISLLLSVLVYRYYSLQITQHQDFLTQSDRNRIRVEVIPPTRGQIVDRKGRVLAANKPTFVVGVIKERSEDLDQLVGQLADRLALTSRELDAFKERSLRRAPFEAVPIKLGLDDAALAMVAVDLHQLPGVVVDAQLTRDYPYGETLSHVLGYVGRVSAEDLLELDNERYRGTLHTGKVGLEKRYEPLLHGQPGFQHVETNAHGRLLRVLEQQAPVPGQNLRLYLDLDLQREAAAALGDQRGAVVALDPLTGGVLAMVSNPSYDANLFVEGISYTDYAELRGSLDTPLLNRAVQGQYPPGSTIKPLLGLGALAEGFVTPETAVPDPGWYRLPGDTRRYRDWTLRVRGGGHADTVDLRMAIAESCDTYYYDLAHRMGIDTMADLLTPYGLGQKTGVDTTGEQPGIMPSTEWKRRAMGEVWYPGETISAGIGQGYMLATPLQLAQATMVIANKGESFVPSVVHRVGDLIVGGVQRPALTIAEKDWQAVVAGMVDVVHSPRGTAAAIGKGLQYSMAGKTGTSQVISIAQDAIYDEETVSERNRNHGLFVAFAPVDKPRIVVAVIAENGGGSSAASPIARRVIDAWLAESGDV
ncbi:MAG: penicillin-binding protein 2 [Luminiphilus sp.]|jgi:penicillin-binding protein 2